MLKTQTYRIEPATKFVVGNVMAAQYQGYLQAWGMSTEDVTFHLREQLPAGYDQALHLYHTAGQSFARFDINGTFEFLQQAESLINGHNSESTGRLKTLISLAMGRLFCLTHNYDAALFYFRQAYDQAAQWVLGDLFETAMWGLDYARRGLSQPTSKFAA